MRCKTCNYRLWNLTERRCPECGMPFLPSAYEFAPQSVQFCCPHCGQGYYGTGDKGHLSPPAFECISCHTRIDMDQMVLHPTTGVEEEQTAVFKVPWVERGERSQLRAWIATIGLALVSPLRLMRALPLDSPTRWAWGFAILTMVVVALVAILPFSAIPLLAFFGFGRGVGGYFVCGVLVVPLIVTAMTLVYVLVWGLAAHGILLLTGRTASGVGRTYQALCYSSGANAVSAVPCLGVYFGWIWWLVSAILMLKEGQRVHGGRAVLAILPLPVLTIAGLVALYLTFLFSALSASPFTPAATQARAAQTQAVLSAVLRYAGQHAGRGPQHAAELVADGALLSAGLICNTSFTQESQVKIGGTTLDQLASLPTPKAHKFAQAAIDALPSGVIAHRLGDYVFTYHGIDLGSADPALWVVIQWPDPVANPAPTPVWKVNVGEAGGTCRAFPQRALVGELARQNALRAGYGLPPLPDPATVTHAQPAIAAP